MDVFEHAPERAFVGTYQLLGYLKADRLVQLSPHRHVATLKPAMLHDELQADMAEDPHTTLQAISAYETAAHAFQHGDMGRRIPAPEGHASSVATTARLGAAP